MVDVHSVGPPRAQSRLRWLHAHPVVIALSWWGASDRGGAGEASEEDHLVRTGAGPADFPRHRRQPTRCGPLLTFCNLLRVLRRVTDR
jgi:hypothetical protein